MDDLFLKELSLGQISQVSSKPRCVHALGRVPKKDSGKSRPITDCSHLLDRSLNDHTRHDLESFRMNSIDNAIAMSEPACFYSIVDIESAWRWVPAFPPHRELQGFRWMFSPHNCSQYQYFVDNRLCFGLLWAPSFFNRLSNAIVRMMRRHHFSCVINYLDDFLIIGKSRDNCQCALLSLTNLLHSLGLNVSWKKVVSPAKRVTVLAIKLNSQTMSLRLLEDKLHRLSKAVLSFSTKSSASKHQLQSLAGSLNFACHVVHGGQKFLHRVLDCINRLKWPSHRCHLSQSFHADIAWWRDFLPTFNSCCMMLDFRQTVYVQADASFQGFRAVCSHDWVAGLWLPSRNECFLSLSSHSHWSSKGHAIDRSLLQNINYLELFPVLVAARRWGPSWTNAFVWNPIIRRLFASTIKELANHRRLCLGCAKFSGSRHLPGSQNIHADALSRLLGPPSPVRAPSFLPS